MPGTIESISTVNSFIRTMLAVLFVGAVGVGGYFGYRTYMAGDLELQEKEEQLVAARRQLASTEAKVQQQVDEINALNEEVALKDQAIERLDTALRLLKVTRRVARLSVVDQGVDPDTNELYSLVEFSEVDEDGQPLETPRRFRIKGDLVYIDNWVVKFEEEYVERADLDRSTSLVLFRRIFGEAQRPKDGFPLDTPNRRPAVYGQGRPMSDFEKGIWDDFWEIANDAARASELGIRAAHGEAPSIKVQKGKTYKVTLRAADGLTITPDQ